jgi:hypothetical protein
VWGIYKPWSACPAQQVVLDKVAGRSRGLIRRRRPGRRIPAVLAYNASPGQSSGVRLLVALPLSCHASDVGGKGRQQSQTGRARLPSGPAGRPDQAFGSFDEGLRPAMAEFNTPTGDVMPSCWSYSTVRPRSYCMAVPIDLPQNRPPAR